MNTREYAVNPLGPNVYTPKPKPEAEQLLEQRATTLFLAAYVAMEKVLDQRSDSDPSLPVESAVAYYEVPDQPEATTTAAWLTRLYASAPIYINTQLVKTTMEPVGPVVQQLGLNENAKLFGLGTSARLSSLQLVELAETVVETVVCIAVANEPIPLRTAVVIDTTPPPEIPNKNETDITEKSTSESPDSGEEVPVATQLPEAVSESNSDSSTGNDDPALTERRSSEPESLENEEGSDSAAIAQEGTPMPTTTKAHLVASLRKRQDTRTAVIGKTRGRRQADKRLGAQAAVETAGQSQPDSAVTTFASRLEDFLNGRTNERPPISTAKDAAHVERIVVGRTFSDPLKMEELHEALDAFHGSRHSGSRFY